jgi:thiol-disulfide isomerase/thioredoxin
VIALALLSLAPALQDAPFSMGEWDAWLKSPGGELHFELAIEHSQTVEVFILNGEERIEIPEVSLEGDELVLAMPHYDSKITATLGPRGLRLDGTWTKVGSAGSLTKMGFHATHRSVGTWAKRDTLAIPTELEGRWSVKFAGSEDRAVGVFRSPPKRNKLQMPGLRGTFMTTLGDYRFLAGRTNGAQFELSCFDGAHAFLFKGELKPTGEIEGDFWSRDTWHETWTAVRDEQASLPDPFGLTSWNEDVKLESLVFPDLSGTKRSLADPAFAGKARILKLFGTWCPNCNDEAPYLAELDRRYRARGLRVVGLAFEHTGEFARDVEQVRRYAKLHEIEFPLLLAGISDKKDASQRFPLIDRVRAYPTTIFMRADGSVRAIHTGFAGPATGAEHTKLREDFERLIEELLAEGQ